ncbi:MAG TPA: hypothetical protein VKX25_10985 [Bryobacteraceae bacterium]|jgi:hypothetical protein|nr:hypothetical protein [Bryobacteraceae bacterium]
MTANPRPLAVTVVAWLYIAVGTIGFIAHLADFVKQHTFGLDALEIEAVETVALVSGIFLLRGRNWARWLAIAWIGFHVVLSLFDPLSKLLIHAVLCALVAWALFHRAASRHFRPRAPA